MSENTTASTLAGRVAIVTGGTRGIGAAISQNLLEQGATVVAVFAGNTEKAQQVEEQMHAAFGADRFSTRKAQIQDPEQCRALVADVVAEHGHLDILVNNAGITRDKILAKMEDDDWRSVIDVNLSGTFYLSQAALAHMVERGTGRVVNMSSLIGEMGNLGQANYAASKAGLFGLTKSLAREAAFSLSRSGKLTEDSIGVTVNAITPGYVLTEMVATVPEKILDRIKGNILVQRLAKPSEVARVVSFLCADESSFITGQVWGINGGQYM